MSVDYGSRIRAVCDYLETVPGEKYSYYHAYGRMLMVGDGCGCVTAHGMQGDVIPVMQYTDAVVWLGFSDVYHFGRIIHDGASNGQEAKQAAIRNLRAYADEHYPVKPNSTTKHTGIPESVLSILRVGEAA